MNIKCLFGHKKRLYDHSYYNDISWGYRVPSTKWTAVCDRCGKSWKDHAYDELLDANLVSIRYHGWSKYSPQKPFNSR